MLLAFARLSQTNAIEWSPSDRHRSLSPARKRLFASFGLIEQFEHPLRRPSEHGAIASHNDRSLEELRVSRKCGEHSLVVIKRQSPSARFLHPDHVTRPQTRLDQQLPDL